MIRPYRAIPSAMATKIMDLPKMLPSSLIAPRAELLCVCNGDTTTDAGKTGYQCGAR